MSFRVARFSSISKNDGRRGTFEEELERCILRGRRSTRDMFIRDVRRSGRWFPEKGCISEHQIFRFCWDNFAWQVQHFVWLGITFTWQARYFRHMDWKNHKTHWREAVSCALNFRFLKEVSQNGFVCNVVTFENEEVSKNCFVFDVANFKSWRIPSFWTLSSSYFSKVEEISQNCFVFKLADCR